MRAKLSIPLRFAFDDHFATHEFALGHFSIVDAYLTALPNGSNASGVNLQLWPRLPDYHQRMLQRPASRVLVAKK